MNTGATDTTIEGHNCGRLSDNSKKKFKWWVGGYGLLLCALCIRLKQSLGVSGMFGTQPMMYMQFQKNDLKLVRNTNPPLLAQLTISR